VEVPSLKGELRDLIARYLDLYYVSESCKDGIRTENRYQSIQVGELETPGVRSSRAEILDRIVFSGKTVLDLGSNLGELSRGARGRGATLVDGFESDPFFVELATALNSYGHVTRVSYYERDITDAASYGDHYDVVLAFSVFVYIEPVLEAIASVTDELFVLETHRLEGNNLEDYYVRVVGKHFPHYAIIGESDWDVRLGGEGDRRAVIAFARDEPTLLAALSEADGSPPTVLRAAIAARPGTDLPARILDIDLTKPPKEALQSRFFMMFRFGSPDELLDAIDRMDADVAALQKSVEIRNLGAEGWIYWYLFTKGYLQYLLTGTIEHGNPYFDYLVGYFIEHGHDPAALPDLSEHRLAVERIARRYRDFDALRRAGAQSPDPPAGAKPVRITTGYEPREPPLHLYGVGSDEPLPVKNIDGWHRLFSARVSGLRSFPCEALPENLHNRHIRGDVEEFRFDGERLRARGWFVHPHLLLNYELRLGPAVLGRGVPSQRADVAEAFPHVPHAGESGFALDVECGCPQDSAVSFDLVVMHEIFPVGLIPLVHVPLAGSALGHGAAAIVYQLFRPLVRRAAPESFGTIVECAGSGVSLAPALERLVPGASVTTLGADETGSGAEGEPADLVIAHAVFPALDPGEQPGFLERLGRIVKPGGAVVASVQGELVRALLPEGDLATALVQEGIARGADGVTVQTKEHTLAAFAEAFEVTDYVEGGVGNLYDLVILRKR
jgi:SAM-dependent methyltransferase